MDPSCGPMGFITHLYQSESMYWLRSRKTKSLKCMPCKVKMEHNVMEVWFRWFSLSHQVIFRFQPFIFWGVLTNHWNIFWGPWGFTWNLFWTGNCSELPPRNFDQAHLRIVLILGFCLVGRLFYELGDPMVNTTIEKTLFGGWCFFKHMFYTFSKHQRVAKIQAFLFPAHVFFFRSPPNP